MIRRDYIMKLVQQLLDSLFLLLNEKGLEEEEYKGRLQQFYKDYLGEDFSYYHTQNEETILQFLESKYGDELMQRVEMLTDILYNEGNATSDISQRRDLYLKALYFLNYLDKSSDTYSLVRQGKIDSINEAIRLFES